MTVESTNGGRGRACVCLSCAVGESSYWTPPLPGMSRMIKQVDSQKDVISLIAVWYLSNEKVNIELNEKEWFGLTEYLKSTIAN